MTQKLQRRRVVDYLPLGAPARMAFVVRGVVVREFDDGSMEIEDLSSRPGRPPRLRWIPNDGHIVEELEDGTGR